MTNDDWILFVCKQSFKTDCCLTNSDAHVIGGSEDGMVYFWDLVDAKVVSKFRAHDLVVKTHTHSQFLCLLVF